MRPFGKAFMALGLLLGMAGTAAAYPSVFPTGVTINKPDKAYNGYYGPDQPKVFSYIRHICMTILLGLKYFSKIALYFYAQKLFNIHKHYSTFRPTDARTHIGDTPHIRTERQHYQAPRKYGSAGIMRGFVFNQKTDY